eukprot:1643641-Prorocentrum_lima.AAC.1
MGGRGSGSLRDRQGQNGQRGRLGGRGRVDGRLSHSSLGQRSFLPKISEKSCRQSGIHQYSPFADLPDSPRGEIQYSPREDPGPVPRSGSTYGPREDTRPLPRY